MPIYFMELNDGIRTTVDVEGAEYRDAKVAARDLVATLVQIVSDTKAGQDAVEIIGQVRDEAGHTVYTATLTLRCQDIHDGTSAPD